MTLILGVDDAGRGPVIGPMILTGVLLEKEQEDTIRKEGATDSKLLSQKQRVKLSKIIKKNSISHKTLITYPPEIDKSLQTGTNLNKLEAKKTAEVINSLNSGKIKTQQVRVIIDCPSVNTIAWKKTLMEFIKHPSNLTVVCEHKADFNHAVVSAASILAKVVREEEMWAARRKYIGYGNMGSGYPSDPLTKEFLKKNGALLKDSGIFRKTWSTWKNMFPEEGNRKQKTLSDF